MIVRGCKFQCQIKELPVCLAISGKRHEMRGLSAVNLSSARERARHCRPMGNEGRHQAVKKNTGPVSEPFASRTLKTRTSMQRLHARTAPLKSAKYAAQ